jgi:hypothetical protein
VTKQDEFHRKDYMVMPPSTAMTWPVM